MIHEPAYIKELLEKYLSGTATAVEVARLMVAWDIYDDEELSAMIAEIRADDDTGEKEEFNNESSDEEIIAGKKGRLAGIKTRLVSNHGFGTMLLFTGLLLTACFLIWLFTRHQPKQLPLACNGVPGDTELPTGGYHCSLLLTNNSIVPVNSSFNKPVHDGAMEIMQPEAGLLVFKPAGPLKHKQANTKSYTVLTAAGQQYRIVLPDGSKVRLNAASSVSFPADFGFTERFVYLKGEAFFEVVKGSAPFVVEAGLTQLEMHEANVNVNAYSRNTVTTIQKGSVQVKAGSRTHWLIEGEKTTARVNILVARVELLLTEEDALAALSWKNLTRVYTNVPMREFAADLGRRYNLEMVNVNCIPAAARISESICYNKPIEQVLTIFSDSKLKFYKVGNRITFCDPSLPSKPAKSIPFK